MNQTTYFKNRILDYYFGLVPYAPPATYYLGLLTNPTFQDGDTPLEPVGNGYTRAPVQNSKAVFSTAVGGKLDNDLEIQFALASGADWPQTKFLALFDASSGGNLLAWGDVNVLTGEPATVKDGEKAILKSGSLVIV